MRISDWSSDVCSSYLPEVYVPLADQDVLARNRQGTAVVNGGYGASMEAVPGEEGAFYMLTNRGPVAGGTGAGEKVFIAKRFNPHIAKFKLAGDSMRQVQIGRASCRERVCQYV